MRARKARCTDDRAEIVRVLNAVEHNDKGRLACLLGLLQNIFDFRVFKCGRLSDDSLMMSCLGHLVESLFGHIIHDGPGLFGLAKHRVHRTVVQTFLYK